MEEVSDPEIANTLVTPPKRRGRKKPLFWEHFTTENVSGGDTDGSYGYHRKKTNQWPGYANAIFNHDTSLNNLAKLIIVHEYPLSMVKQPSFISFLESLNPRFKMGDVHGMEGEILSIHQKEKQNLMQAFGTVPGRISLAINLWTTHQTLGYVALSAQFIDTDWKMHRRMLNFSLVSSPHSENALSEAIETSLTDWNLKVKLFTITLDNDCSTNDIYSANLRNHLSNKNSLMLNGQLFVVRCYSHILNVVAQDVIASVHGIVYNIRESIKFVKASPYREEKFAEIALQLEVPSTKTLSLDISAQWNTTYQMMVAALDFKQVFAVLESCDDYYNEAPSPDDWKRVEIACTFLKLLYDSAHAIMSATEPTANIFFHEAWKIQAELSSTVTSEDAAASSIAKGMHEKFDKFWKDSSLMLAITVVMDPRFKMRLVQFSFSKIYGEESDKYVKAVEDAIRDIYHEYAVESEPDSLPLLPAYDEQGNAVNANMEEGNKPLIPPVPTADGLLDFDVYLSEISVGQPAKPELEQYLEESLVPRLQEFDLLNWWKLNSFKYPTLSKMARDILAIPVSTISAGTPIFSSGEGRMLDDYRSSLRPEVLDALFCTKDWLQYFPTVTEAAPGTAIVKTEC